MHGSSSSNTYQKKFQLSTASLVKTESLNKPFNLFFSKKWFSQKLDFAATANQKFTREINKGNDKKPRKSCWLLSNRNALH